MEEQENITRFNGNANLHNAKFLRPFTCTVAYSVTPEPYVVLLWGTENVLLK